MNDTGALFNLKLNSDTSKSVRQPTPLAELGLNTQSPALDTFKVSLEKVRQLDRIRDGAREDARARASEYNRARSESAARLTAKPIADPVDRAMPAPTHRSTTANDSAAMQSGSVDKADATKRSDRASTKESDKDEKISKDKDHDVAQVTDSVNNPDGKEKEIVDRGSENPSSVAVEDQNETDEKVLETVSSSEVGIVIGLPQIANLSADTDTDQSQLGDSVIGASGEMAEIDEAALMLDEANVDAEGYLEDGTALPMAAATSNSTEDGGLIPPVLVEGEQAALKKVDPKSSQLSESLQENDLMGKTPASNETLLNTAVKGIDGLKGKLNLAGGNMSLGEGVAKAAELLAGKAAASVGGIVTAQAVASGVPFSASLASGTTMQSLPGNLLGQSAAFATMQNSLGSPAFGDELAQKLSMFVGKSIQSAQLIMNPAELGPIEIKLQLHKDQAHIQVQTSVPMVRDLVEGSAQRLREMLAEQGMQLTKFDVSSRHSEQGQSGHNQQNDPSGQGGRQGSGSSESMEAGKTRVIGLTPDRLVDFYA